MSTGTDALDDAGDFRTNKEKKFEMDKLAGLDHSSLPGSSSGAARSEQLAPMLNNVANTQRPGMVSSTPVDRDTPTEDHGRPLLVPDRPGEAGGRSQSCWQAMQADTGADLGHFQGAGIAHSDDPEGPNGDLWQANISGYMYGRGDSERGHGIAVTGAAKEHQIWADCTDAEQNFHQLRGATDFASVVQCPRGQGGMVEGNLRFISGVERGEEGSRGPKAGNLNKATQLQNPAGELMDLSNQRQRTPQS